MTWKTSLPILIVEYIMCALIITLLILPTDISNSVYWGIMIPYFILLVVSLILMVLHLAFAIRNRNKLERKHLVQSLIFQILLFPVSMFSYVIAIIYVVAGTMLTLTIFYGVIGIPILLVSVLIWMYQGLLTLFSSPYPIMYLWSKRDDENPILLIIAAFFQLFFFANIIDSVILLSVFPKDVEPKVVKSTYDFSQNQK